MSDLAEVQLAARMVRIHEGCELRPYTDTVGKMTIGYGRNLSDRGITVHEAEIMLKTDLAIAHTDARDLAGGDLWASLSTARRAVLIDMAYNLGKRRLKGFTRMWAALRVEDFDTAASQMLDSHWASQVGQRAINLAETMRTGNVP